MIPLDFQNDLDYSRDASDMMIERGQKGWEKRKEDRIGERLAEGRMVETQGRNDEHKG